MNSFVSFVEDYLDKTGWEMSAKYLTVSIWHKPGNPNVEIVLPTETHLKDYKQRVLEVVEMILNGEVK